MKKSALITITGNYNYGNKLQHYALQKYLERFNIQTETVFCYTKNKNVEKIKDFIKTFVKPRYSKFKKFDSLIKYSKMYIYNNKLNNLLLYDYYIVGSDQVWNTNFPFFNKEYLLNSVESNNKISYASSFGTETLPSEYNRIFKDELLKFKYISVREDAGKRIIEELTGRTDVEVLVDPTMLLTAEEWDKVSKKPKHLKSNQRYILNYFLGELSEKRRNEIRRVAEKNDCEIINILDEKDPFYTSGPSEFLYLEKHAFLICTDSFHSSVFAIIYDKPFIVFEREDDTVSMNSRLETLLNKFKLNTRYCKDDKINEMLLNHDYTEAYKILEKEKQKSYNFIRKALENN